MVITMVPFMIIGMFGTLTFICLPLCVYYKKLSCFNDKSTFLLITLLRKGAFHVLKYTQSEIRRMKSKGR